MTDQKFDWAQQGEQKLHWSLLGNGGICRTIFKEMQSHSEPLCTEEWIINGLMQPMKWILQPLWMAAFTTVSHS